MADLSTADRAARVRFRRALALMAMTLVLPGSAQLASGNTRVGRAALRTWYVLLLVGAGCLVAAAVHHEFAFWLVSDLAALQTVRIVLMVLAVAWAVLFVDAWRLGAPLTLSMGHRRAAVGINGILCFSMASVLLFSAHLVGVQRDIGAARHAIPVNLHHRRLVGMHQAGEAPHETAHHLIVDHRIPRPVGLVVDRLRLAVEHGALPVPAARRRRAVGVGTEIETGAESFAAARHQDHVYVRVQVGAFHQRSQLQRGLDR